jgi:hypothetical protein
MTAWVCDAWETDAGPRHHWQLDWQWAASALAMPRGSQYYASLLTAAALRAPFQSFSRGVARAIV